MSFVPRSILLELEPGELAPAPYAILVRLGLDRDSAPPPVLVRPARARPAPRGRGASQRFRHAAARRR